MKTTFSLFVTLIFMQWHSTSVEAEGSSVATITGAMQKDNQYMTVVEDEDAKSGWAVEVKKAISEKDSTDRLFMFFYTRTDPNGKFKETFAAPLCYLLLQGDEPSKFLYKQITEMIFRKQKGSCEFKARETLIAGKRAVNTDPSDANPADFLPEETPFEVEAQLLNYDQANNPDPENYLIKVSFKVDEK